MLKSSEEKVLRVDKENSSSSTEENDTSGGTRKITSAELKESTILTGQGENTAPIVEKKYVGNRRNYHQCPGRRQSYGKS